MSVTFGAASGLLAAEASMHCRCRELPVAERASITSTTDAAIPPGSRPAITRHFGYVPGEKLRDNFFFLDAISASEGDALQPPCFNSLPWLAVFVFCLKMYTQTLCRVERFSGVNRDEQRTNPNMPTLQNERPRW